ncbi:MAG TPA: DUF222 domain-containing protein, partial [Actinomycetota bacterium]|nr:DUF222 domain-containing protein [Actinomycetota bacterium]
MRSEVDLRAGLDVYPDDPRRVPDHELERGIQELERLSLAAQAKKLRWVAEAERRAVFCRDGYVSSTDWLSDRLNLARGTARGQLKTAQVLEAVPEVKEAMSNGEVSSSSVRVLTAAWESHPEAFEATGSTLLKEAKRKPIGDLRRSVDEWRHRQDQDGGREQARKARERRRLDLAPSASSMVGVNGELDPEGGEYVLTAVQAIVDADI